MEKSDGFTVSNEMLAMMRIALAARFNVAIMVNDFYSASVLIAAVRDIENGDITGLCDGLCEWQAEPTGEQMGG